MNISMKCSVRMHGHGKIFIRLLCSIGCNTFKHRLGLEADPDVITIQCRIYNDYELRNPRHSISLHRM